ncbi:hypothetical protein Tco_1260705, partial [Tanacetum coccineum]
DGVVRVLSPVTVAEIQAVEKERMMQKRFGKPSALGLEKGYDRFQQLLSQLEAHGAEVSTEDANHKFLRSLPSAWSNPLQVLSIRVHVEQVNYLLVIMEYLVNISKRRAFWSLNEDILKINDFDYQYAVSIKEDTVYPCLHSPKTTKEISSIRRVQIRTICRIGNILCEYSGGYQAWSLLQETPIRLEYGISTSIGYGVSSSLSNTTYSSQQINMAYPLPLDMAYQLSGTEA